jgi:hypothetical protein
MGYEDLCSQLESIGEALTERSIETLQAAIRDGAQRSIDKAIHILRDLDAEG